MKNLFLSSYFANIKELFIEYIKDNVSTKRLTFIPTASKFDGVDFYVKEALDVFKSMGLDIDILDISTSSFDNIKDKLQNNDFIYVCGGNTFFLLKELKRTGADKIIIEQINLGKLYIGESAGSIILSSNIDYIKYMDSNKEVGLKSFDSLNIVDFYPVPHNRNFPFAESTQKIIQKYQDSIKLLPFNNDEIILVNGDQYKIIQKENS